MEEDDEFNYFLSMILFGAFRVLLVLIKQVLEIFDSKNQHFEVRLSNLSLLD